MIRPHLPGLVVLLVLLGACPASSQVVPATPTKSATRSLGGNSVSGGATVEPAKSAPLARYITYLVLAESRTWTSTDAKLLVGKLIAFEDLVTTAPRGAEPPPAAVPPAHPTVVRGGKVRLLIERKACEVTLERLSQPDRDFIEQIRTARAPGK